MRLSLRLEDSTRDLFLGGAYQLSADCDTWGTAVALTGSLSSNTTYVPDAFDDLKSTLDGSQMLYIRFGGLVKNVAYTGLELARASFRLDLRRC